MTRLTAGKAAPKFSLLDQEGDEVRLADQKGTPVLVYFYPRADTPGCTRQACALRDAEKMIGKAVVLGISPDQPEALKKFDLKYSLGFTLLSDPEHQTAEAYGVWVEKNNYGKKYMGVERSAFFVDERGVLQNAWYKISPEDTATKFLDALGV